MTATATATATMNTAYITAKNNAIVSDSEESSICSSSNKKCDNNERRKRKVRDESEEEKRREERRAANRRSAFESRQRRRLLIEDLQETVTTLSKENSDVRNENAQLRHKLDTLLQEFNQFKLIMQLTASSQQASRSPLLGNIGPMNIQQLLTKKSLNDQLVANGVIQQHTRPTTSSRAAALEAINDTSHLSAAYARIQALTRNTVS